jgi:hypothetical protein
MIERPSFGVLAQGARADDVSTGTPVRWEISTTGVISAMTVRRAAGSDPSLCEAISREALDVWPRVTRARQPDIGRVNPSRSMR